MYKKIFLLSIVVTSIPSCMHFPWVADEGVRVVRVSEKSAWDLECEKDSIKVTKINDTTYGAEGCGKRASYLMTQCGSGIMWGYNASVCTAILNSGDGVAEKMMDTPNGQSSSGNAAGQHIMHHSAPM